MDSEAYGDFAWVYDSPLGEPFAQAARRELTAIIRRFLGDERGSALDLACGTGLSTGLLTELGFDAIGIDASLSMLAQARKRARGLVAGDLRTLPLTRRFRLVTCLYDSFNHLLEMADLQAAMNEVSRVLDEDGLFLFDMNQPDVYPAIWTLADPFKHHERSRSIEMKTSFDTRTRIATAVIRGRFRTALGTFRFREVRRQRAWRHDEIASALLTAGLRIEARTDFDPFDQSRDSGIGIKWLFAARQSS